MVAAGTALAMLALIVGLARPARAERVPREDAVVMLVLDTSDSMLATDVAPNRLDAAAQAAGEFVAGMPDRLLVGLVTYDRAAAVRVSPTDDHDAVVAALADLDTTRGTDTGAGLEAALDAIEGSVSDEGEATVVLLSDGVTSADPLEAATERAAEAEVPVNTIAYGTDAGTVVTNGEEEAVPADPAAMAEVAEATGGETFEAESSDALARVYEELAGRVANVVEQREVVGPFIGAGFVALAASAALSLLWTVRFL